MKVLSTDGLTKLIELIKNGFISVDDTVTTSTTTLATVATSGSYDDLSDKPTIPVAQVNSDWNATSGKAQILNKPTLATVATSGSYNDLSNKPTIPSIGNAEIEIQKNGTKVDSFTANQSTNKTINITVPTSASDVNALPSSTKYGATIDVTLSTTDYKQTITLKDQDGNTLNSKTVDFPVESMVVSGTFDSTNKKIVLTLQNGNTTDIPVGDLISGLQTEITSTNKLSADLIADGTTNKVVTASEKTTWNGKQNAISDLATIRTNASNGNSAYTTIQGYGDIVTHDADEFLTEHQDLSGYQTKITSSNKLSADLLSEGTTNKLVSASEKTTWNNKLDTSAISDMATKTWVGNQGYTSNVGTVTSVNNAQPDASGNVELVIPDSLPSQTGNANKFLTTDGTDASWSTVPTRNIGEIVSSTIPLTDAGLHLLDGSLIQGGGIYSEFVDYIAGLVSTYPSIFTTESAWQSSVSTYGVCGKFVYDSTNNTVRLPKVTGIIEGTTDVNALGDLVQAGLPNIQGSAFLHAVEQANIFNDVTGALRGAGGSSNSYRSPASLGKNSGAKSSGGITLDASRSSSIYGNSSTVQPQTIKCYYYIVIATSTKTDIEVDIDNIATDLNGKADTDLTNVTDTAKVLMSGMGMPSDRYINLTLGASGTTYTAPANGYFSILARSTNLVRFDGLMYNVTMPVVSSSLSAVIFPILKGKTITLQYETLDLSDSWNYFRFIYAKGSESEAS